MAKAFEVSLDELLLDEGERRTKAGPASKVAERVLTIEALSEEDVRSLMHFLDAIEAKNKLKAVLANVR